MKHIFKKLNGKRGAAIIIAIMIFMLLALGGASAIIMATANAGRFAHSAKEQQPYYTVTSAANLMLDLMDNSRYISSEIQYTYERNWDYTNDPQNDHPQYDGYKLNFLAIDKTTKSYYKNDGRWAVNSDLGNSSIEIKSKSDEGVLAKNNRHILEKSNMYNSIKGWCDYLMPYLAVPQEWYSTLRNGDGSDPDIEVKDFRPTNPEALVFPFTISTSSATFGEVQAKLIMTGNFDIIMSFSVKGDNELIDGESAINGDSDQTMFAVNVYWKALVDVETGSDAPVYDVGTGTGGTQTIKQTRVVTVNWKKENATISRGEAIIPENSSSTTPTPPPEPSGGDTPSDPNEEAKIVFNGLQTATDTVQAGITTFNAVLDKTSGNSGFNSDTGDYNVLKTTIKDLQDNIKTVLDALSTDKLDTLTAQKICSSLKFLLSTKESKSPLDIIIEACENGKHTNKIDENVLETFKKCLTDFQTIIFGEDGQSGLYAQLNKLIDDASV